DARRARPQHRRGAGDARLTARETGVTDESNLLQAVLADPTDDLLLLAYADWLEDRTDEVSAAKAAFLRLTGPLLDLPTEEAPEARKRLQELAAGLDTDWLAVVSRLEVENCGRRRRQQDPSARFFAFQCDRKWDQMRPTGDANVRHCASCGEDVYY